MPAAIQTPALPSEVLMIAETQWLFTDAELLQTPSIIAGLPPETERENRSKGVNFILQVGIMLKLPQITLATASVFLHRFYMRHPMKWAENNHGFHHYEVGATSLFLATKVEENCRKMKELVIACCRVAQKDPHKLVDEQDKEYWRWRDVILLNEDVMLEAICFDLSLEPPYKTLFEHLVFFGEGENNRLRNAAWAFVNDSYLTLLCLLFPSRTIATTALYAAAKHCGAAFPDDEQGRPWWDVVGVDISDIRRACEYMASMYEGVPSKAGRDGGVYERLTDTGGDDNDKTRAARATRETERSPKESSANGAAVSPTANGNDTKRAHDEFAQDMPKLASNGTSHEVKDVSSLNNGNESPNKRQKVDNNHAVESNGNHTSQSADQSDPASRPNGASLPNGETSRGGGPRSPKDDDVSEEGEVEA